MLVRNIEQSLLDWKSGVSRKPLLIRGARQVGKSHAVVEFGKRNFHNVLVVNFERNREYQGCFERLEPKRICDALSLIMQQSISPGKTLLFLDEIQDCPKAIQALRYFKEELPELHVIGAGSALDLVLNQADFRMPVGRTSHLYMHPLSFHEYLRNFDPHSAQFLEEIDTVSEISVPVHQHLLEHVHRFMVIGGMPDSLMAYRRSERMLDVQQMQDDLLISYEQDFGHYDRSAPVALLKHCFQKIPHMIGHVIKYSKLHPDVRSRELKVALNLLENAHILHRISCSYANTSPLGAGVNDKKFKMGFLDCGLLNRVLGLGTTDIGKQFNQGAMTEQFVGQELLGNTEYGTQPKLYFWARDGAGRAEIDYLYELEGKIYPIEVKSSSIGSMKSLQLYMEKHQCIGIRISQKPLSFKQNVLSVPLYLMHALPKLLQSVAT